MIGVIRNVICFVIVGLAYLFTNNRIRQRYNSVTRAVLIVLCVCMVFIALAIATRFIPTQSIEVIALNEKNPESKETTVYIKSINAGILENNGDPVEGYWIKDGSWYKWYAPSDSRYEEQETTSIQFEAKDAFDGNITFWGNEWKGTVKVKTGNQELVIDTYSGEGDVDVIVPLTFNVAQVLSAIFIPVGVFAGSYIVLALIAYAFALIGRKCALSCLHSHEANGIVQRFVKYKFLFEELVKRDFKKKYKRTVLGMAWSVLSPLLTLLVMRLVFTNFFGRNAMHYTIYLFCGNLIYSYFNESTTQGMTSLMSNAGIFTKVNVPKYMFLLSKNVQTLINFGLTLCVFFIFCALDKITFTWKFVLLLYPIATLVLFNIGVGMILSALYVFFRDIQYLWQIFTLLLMYMSAIFYYIDSYSLTVRYLFLLNPVYLHIRYFRKIVIDSVIPTPEFHLLMLFDVVVVLLFGRWMYKKYNTEFLYYL